MWLDWGTDIILVIQLLSISAEILNPGNILPTPPICGVNPVTNRIIGGTILDLDEHPWAALLDFELTLAGKNITDYQCGGVLINSRYVLTVAHCLQPTFENVKRKLLVVRLGEYDLLQNPVDCQIDKKLGTTECAAEPVDIAIEKAITHPHFDMMTKFNDIALLRLAKPVEYTSSIKPICLPNAATPDLKTNETLYSIGWGNTNPKSIENSPSSVKRIVGVRLWNIEECRSKFSSFMNQLCAGGEENQDACLGDSGGPFVKPVFQYWYLEGIISHGHECGKAGWPGVYTNIRSYIEWIKQNLEP